MQYKLDNELKTQVRFRGTRIQRNRTRKKTLHDEPIDAHEMQQTTQN